jgi:hypothetical protein
MSEIKHLWEIDHPYYCNEGNYYAHESVEGQYDSWANFLEEEGDSDMDYNLLFRWDWWKADPNDENHCNKTDVLMLFWMGQRKGLYRYTTVHVTDADETEVKEWLAKRWAYLVLLWEGVSTPQADRKT